MTKILQNETFAQNAAGIAFHKFVRRYVMHARDLARSGQKDTARDWHRFFTNAQVVKMLSAHSQFEDSTLAELTLEISSLGVECHPLDAANWSTDIQAIRAALEMIVENLPRKIPSKDHGLVARAGGKLSPAGASYEASFNWRKSHKRGVK